MKTLLNTLEYQNYRKVELSVFVNPNDYRQGHTEQWEGGGGRPLCVVVEVVHGDALRQLGRLRVGLGRARGQRQALGLHAHAQPLDEAQPLQRVGRVRRAAHLQRLRDVGRQLQHDRGCFSRTRVSRPYRRFNTFSGSKDRNCELS